MCQMIYVVKDPEFDPLIVVKWIFYVFSGKRFLLVRKIMSTNYHVIKFIQS
jgi:hypothetical protein